MELAALGPNLLIFNFFTYLLNALCISTVSAMSDHLRQSDTHRAGHVLSSALFLAGVSGLIVMGIFLVRHSSTITFCIALHAGPEFQPV